MSKLLIVEIPESESAHLTALGFVMNTWELPTAEKLGSVARDARIRFSRNDTSLLTREEYQETLDAVVGNAIIECIRRKP